MPNELINELMKDLIQYTRERALAYRTFTGATIIEGQEVICRDITSVEKDQDPLAHAELKALRTALAIKGGSLEGCQILTTQQPCPMCASAMVWSGIDAVYFGLPTNHQWKKEGEMQDFFLRMGVRCTGPIFEAECKAIDDYLIANGI